jgi:hypothetical protein
MPDPKDIPDDPQPPEPPLKNEAKSEFDRAVDDFDALVALPVTGETGPITGVPQPVEYSVRTTLDPSRWTMVDPDPDYRRDVTLLRDPNKLATSGGERGSNLYIITGPIYLRLMEAFPNMGASARRYTLRCATYRRTDELVVFAVMHPLDGNEKSEAAYRGKLRIAEELESDWGMALKTDEGFKAIRTELPNRDPVVWSRLYRGMSMKAILFKAFRDSVIDSWDHAVIRVIRGL